MDHVSSPEGVFGLSGSNVFRAFNALLFLVQQTRENSPSRITLAVVRDYLTGAKTALSPEGDFCSETDALAHAELAQAALILQSQAFLTDEQKIELQSAGDKLFADWQRLCVHVGRMRGWELAVDRVNLMRVDATFLSHLEWMCEVGFEKCEPALRADILTESPLFYLFSTKGFC